jgi:hypothetical protein
MSERGRAVRTVHLDTGTLDLYQRVSLCGFTLQTPKGKPLLQRLIRISLRRFE